MIIFNRIALQGLKKNRTQTLVTIIGVILSTAMITAVVTFGTSLLHFLVQSSMAKYGDWQVAFFNVDPAFIKAQAEDPAVSSIASFEDMGYASLDDVKTPEKPYLFIAGFGENTRETLPISLISGRLPENSAEVLIPSHLALKGGIKLALGETLSLTLGTRNSGGQTLSQHTPYTVGETLTPREEKAYTIVGTYERPGFEEQSAPGYTAITQTDSTNTAIPSTLFVTLKNPRDLHTYLSGLPETTPHYLNEDVLRFMGLSDNGLFNTLLYTTGGILIAIITVGSIFLIYNAFNIALNERTHQFGILLSVGATERQLQRAVIFEGLCIGGMGIPLGILTGIGSIALLLPVVAKNFSTITTSSTPLTLWVSLPALGVAAAVSLITILVSAYLPARRAAHIPVMDCIRQTDTIKIHASAVKTNPHTQHLLGLEGTLALKNFKRNKKRYRSVVLSLTLSVVLFVAGSAFGTTLKQLAKAYTVEMDGDIIFSAEEMGEDRFLKISDTLKTASGVYRSALQADATYPGITSNLPADFVSAYRAAEGDPSTGDALALPIDVQFVSDEIYTDFIKSQGLPLSEYTGPGAKVLALAANNQEHRTYFTGSTMTFTLVSDSGSAQQTIGATFVDSYPLDPLAQSPSKTQPVYTFMMVVPYQLKAQFDTLGIPARYGLTLWSETPAASMVQIQSMISEAGLTTEYTLVNLSTAVDLFRNAIFVVDVFTGVFLVMISLIAIANVFNTISTNIRLRRRELAMLRSVGMSEGDFNRMMAFECLFYGLRTLLFGVPISGLLAWLIHQGLMAQEKLDGIAFVFPWGSLAISTLGIFAIVLTTMVYATHKIKKENIIDALRDELT
ncbi:FtsX-like permease family protein [Eubacterium barkeri]|uniref:Putative ABC transport system permease protein n=1 Tax=Eubacterium barkeri TaxID=1528 RepID=A0A1H3JES5_EUBBA|nr:FtsX-like permease family protein [Eubacterium barkeri]SDY38411.1 putative ABC transport system permease protein [Eubacterium barkeri]